MGEERNPPIEAVDPRWFTRPPTGAPAVPADHFMKPSPARLWNYFQGGRDNYGIDQQVGAAIAAPYPAMFEVARQSRLFLDRALRYLAGEAGVRQFLDLGCGLPVPTSMRNTHEVVQDIAPSCRVVYVDNDKVVLAHARALLTGRHLDSGPIDYLDADVRDIHTILERTGATLDIRAPVAVLMLGILGAIGYDEALAVVAALATALPAGSFLVHQDGVDNDPAKRKSVQQRARAGASDYELRSPAAIAHYFAGMSLVAPGTVALTSWRPDPVDIGTVPPANANLATVARLH